jgi:alkylation response protein AidB-like acyl-CoA dehydrogenase
MLPVPTTAIFTTPNLNSMAPADTLADAGSSRSASDSDLSLDRVRAAAREIGTDADAALALARSVGAQLPQPGDGATAQRWAALTAAAEGGLTAARVLEAHADALAILAEARSAGHRLDEDIVGDAGSRTWGVFAAEAPAVRLEGRTHPTGGVTLNGTKPWCSLADRLDRALVTAHVTGAAGRGLFAVALQQPGVRVEPPEGWVARGLPTVTSGPVHFTDVRAAPVGEAGWYLERPGFAWGGMGVAACWYGGALPLARRLRERASRQSPEMASLDALHLGAVDAALYAAGVVLRAAADDIDAGRSAGAAGTVAALRVRAVVADAVELTLRQVGHALGPAPLAFDDDHAQRVADLELYVRQHHGERDLAALGSAVARQ